MSILTFSSSSPARRQPRISLSALPTLWAEAVQAWRVRKASHAMQGLSDELLHDIGVARSEIEQVTRFGRTPRA